MTCKVYPLGYLKQYKYVVVLSEYHGMILLSQHRNRSTWETQGGHIEPGETPLEAARRELYEESGAVDYEIIPLCDYWAGTENTDDWANGMVFRAVIRTLDAIPQSEMARAASFSRLPDNLTYPAITPVLFDYLENRVCIRPVRPGDEAILAHIQTESWKSAFGHILAADLLEKYTCPEPSRQMYRKLLESEKGHGYILELDGAPHCIAWWDQSRTKAMPDYAELICIHSLPENRCKGYGSRMMEFILSDMAKAGYHKVMLWVFEKNLSAIAFYKKHGFLPNGQRQEAFGCTEIMLTKT